MLDSKFGLIQRVPLFQGLSRAQLSAIVRVTKKAFFEAGEDLVAQDESGDTSYLIMSGEAICPRIVNGHEVDEHLGPGTLVGELAMLVETIHNYSVIAKQRVRAMAIQRDALRAVMEADTSIAEHISEYLIEKLRELAAELRAVDAKLAGIERSPAPHFYCQSAEEFRAHGLRVVDLWPDAPAMRPKPQFSRYLSGYRFEQSPRPRRAKR